MTIGYPIGGLLGGFAVAGLVVPYGWQSVFVFGAVATAAFLPLAWFLLPESLEFLGRQNTLAARAKIDAELIKMGHPPIVGDLPPAPDAARGGSFAELLGQRFRRTTILLVAAYFFHIMTFYFFSGWLPKLMSDIGYTTPDAIRTSALMSMGGVIGGSMLGWAAPQFGLTRLLILAMIGTSATFAVFGMVSGLAALQAVAFVAGMCVFGGIVGLYALLARSFPPELRVTGTGLAIGIGRGGAILGPLIGGFLIAGGTSIPLAGAALLAILAGGAPTATA
jgi:MFS family permease